MLQQKYNLEFKITDINKATDMKKKLLILALSLTTLNAGAADHKSKGEILKAVRHYQRLMESAHPSIDPQYLNKLDINTPMFKSEATLPKFLNINKIDDETGEESKMQNESSIAVNPTNPLNLIASAVDYRAKSSTWVYVSDDGGKTWRNINLGKPFEGWQSTNDPSVYFSLDGIGYLCYGGFGESLENSVGENAVFLAKTTNQGKTWKAHIPVIVHKGTQTLDSLFEDKYYVQVDNATTSKYFKHVYIPWKRVSPRDSATQIVMSKSIDEGETWSIPINISNRLPGSSEDTTFGQSFPICTTGPDGEVYIAWNHGIEHGIGFAKSSDGGKTFTEPRIIQRYNIFGTTTEITGQGYRHTVKKKVRAESYPTLICDNSKGPRSGYLYLTWAADKVPNIYFSRSTDAGVTWSAPIIVHSDTTNDQFWQWMSIDPTSGDLGIMYFDSRNDTANTMVECYVSYSSDGGLTWKDRRAADQKSDLRLNPFTAKAFAGDYSGSAFYNGNFYPTWVDMRNAEIDIVDSDVYSAIINTRAANPVDNLQVKIIPENPYSLNLKWDNPTERSFGQELKDADYTIQIARNGSYIKNLPGGSNSFTDTELTPYAKYTYQVFTVAAGDSSMARIASSYSGGAKEPAVAEVYNSVGNAQNAITLNVKLPNKRADGETPLTNLKSIDIYRDTVFVRTQDLQKSDTSKVITIADNTSEVGYYTYSFIVKDEFGNQSKPSASYIAFSGDIKYNASITENFDADKLKKYYIGGTWLQTGEIAKSKPNSLSNAPFKNYANKQADTLMLFPIVTNNEQFYVNFEHCAFIANGDYGIVEYSTDGGITWIDTYDNSVARWSIASYAPWADGQMNDLDWKTEEMKLPITNDTITIRFRFFANAISNNKGWYLDNIKISNSPSTSVDDIIEDKKITVFPNPGNEYVDIKLNFGTLSNTKYMIIDMLGAIVLEGNLDLNKANISRINTLQLNTGMYYLIIGDSHAPIARKQISIIR